MAVASDMPLRSAPKQQRAHRTVALILATAEALFAELGFEQTTTNAIALRAEISIGCLYKFFSNKEDILRALVATYTTNTQEVLERLLMVSEEIAMDQLVDQLIEGLMKIQQQKPFYLQCLARAPLGPGSELEYILVAQMTKIIERKSRDIGRTAAELRSRICVAAIDALLPLVIYARGTERAKVIAEIKRLLLGYLVPKGNVGVMA